MYRYLDIDRLEDIDVAGFRTARPYPWVNAEGLITSAGFQDLLDNMPDMALFEKKFGYERRGGQQPHDRYSLEYTGDTPVPAPWQEFIRELRSDRYRQAIARLFDARRVRFRFHWHYTPSGCSVSPHTDARREEGSHLFYFNAPGEWDPSWGGDTLVLDDGGRLDRNSAPQIEDFDAAIPCKSLGNYSAILKRCDHGWHAVREIRCPEGHVRRVFIVVVDPDTLFWRTRDRVVGKKAVFF